jgi:hypothetical protein
MRLSEQLKQAKDARIKLHVGLEVRIRTREGETIIDQGRITEVDVATHTVRVVDELSGATLEVDVDVDRYEVYVLEPGEQVPLWPPDVSLYVRASMPGVTKFRT